MDMMIDPDKDYFTTNTAEMEDVAADIATRVCQSKTYNQFLHLTGVVEGSNFAGIHYWYY